MKNSSFAHSFWIAFIPTGFFFLTWLHYIWQKDYSRLPRSVAPPVWGQTYVAGYDLGGNHGYVDYAMYHTGIFGFKQRINHADILLFGTSHVMFGLSAAQLGQKISTAEGHPVEVYNLGLTGTSLGVIDNILTQHKVCDKTAVFDLFFLDPIPGLTPDYMQEALAKREDDLQAYIQVSKCWTEFWRDWLLDGFLPNLRIGNPLNQSKIIISKRFLKLTFIRSMANGDAIVLWHPTEGIVFPNPDPKAGHPISDTNKSFVSLPNGMIGQHLGNDLLGTNRIQAIYTLIPYDGFREGSIPAEAKPFIPISSDGVYTWDGAHLNGEGRAVVTEQFFEGMQKLGLQAVRPASQSGK